MDVAHHPGCMMCRSARETVAQMQIPHALDVRRSPIRFLVLVFLIFAALGCTGASASVGDEQALAKRYAPVVRLVKQEKECGPGEPYEPMDVDALFGQPPAGLRGRSNASDIVKIGPTAKDLSRGLYEYHLDFPGSALEPGCDYERWSRRITKGHQPTVYAHVVGEPDRPDRLPRPYWIFSAYNDWNNLHEGDWEMVQLLFDAKDARQALTVSPTAIGYSQHE